mmetsp:Transcript_83315/g.222768  ORF Transcript_83315/g.222768 Transcript_83315/m.222768 type:complete len:268 (+) Transcript_83315:1026-1829(+)
MHQLVPALAGHRPGEGHYRPEEALEIRRLIMLPHKPDLREQVQAQHRVEQEEQHQHHRHIDQLGDGQDERHKQLVQSLSKSQQAKQAGYPEEPQGSPGRGGLVYVFGVHGKAPHEPHISGDHADEVEQIPVLTEVPALQDVDLQGSLQIEDYRKDLIRDLIPALAVLAGWKICGHHKHCVGANACSDGVVEGRPLHDFEGPTPHQPQLVEVGEGKIMLPCKEFLLGISPPLLGLRHHEPLGALLLLDDIEFIDDHPDTEVQDKKAPY